jgi:hypothetical protein
MRDLTWCDRVGRLRKGGLAGRRIQYEYDSGSPLNLLVCTRRTYMSACITGSPGFFIEFACRHILHTARFFEKPNFASV